MTQLSRKLDTFGLTMIAVGSCIGSGIFITPAMIAGHLPSFWSILGVWFLGGLLALTGALSLAFLGILFPQTGGVYIYLRERYGNWAAFSYGWIVLTVITSGAIAALSLAFARYVDFLIPLGEQGRIILAVLAIVIVTLINVRGVDKADLFSRVFTLIKLFGIILVIAFGISAIGSLPEELETMPISDSSGWWSAWAGAMIGVGWSYGGWHHASYVAGEAINPSRSVPRAMVLGAGIVILAYVATNWSYLQLLGPGVMAESSAVASDAISVRHHLGANLVALLIALSTFGTIGIYTLSAPRIYFAMAKDGVFFSGLTKVHPKFKTPVSAIFLQSAWAIVLVLFWGTFEKLITYVVFMDWVFMILAVFAVFGFYKSNKTDYKIPLYPLPPLIYVGITTLFLIRILFDQPEQAWAGLILLGLGFPVYKSFKRNKEVS